MTRTSKWVVAGVAAVGVILAVRELVGPHSVPARVDKQQSIWNARAPEVYAYTYSIGGMCSSSEVRVTVGPVTSSTSVIDDSCLVPDGISVEEVFAKLRHAYRTADSVHVTYDPRYGFPSSGATDDEWGLNLTSFTPLSAQRKMHRADERLTAAGPTHRQCESIDMANQKPWWRDLRGLDPVTERQWATPFTPRQVMAARLMLVGLAVVGLGGLVLFGVGFVVFLVLPLVLLGLLPPDRRRAVLGHESRPQ